MLVQYGEHCMAQKVVYKIQHGMKILSGEECWDWPSTSWTDDHRAKVDALIKENRQITVSEIALTMVLFKDQHLPSSMITLATTKSVQEGTMTAKGRTQTYPFVDISEFLAERQPRKKGSLATSDEYLGNETWFHH